MARSVSMCRCYVLYLDLLSLSHIDSEPHLVRCKLSKELWVQRVPYMGVLAIARAGPSLT